MMVNDGFIVDDLVDFMVIGLLQWLNIGEYCDENGIYPLVN